MSKPHYEVAVGIILKENQQILLARRPEGKPWPGWWEFPGGKIEASESAYQALCRELKEELNIQVQTAHPWFNMFYEYPSTTVHLSFWKVTQFTGHPQGMEQQIFTWTTPSQAHQLGNLLPASIAPLRWLTLPSCIYQSNIQSLLPLDSYLKHLEQQLSSQLGWVEFCLPTRFENIFNKELKACIKPIQALCHQYQSKLLINSIYPKSWWSLADGVILRPQDAIVLDERPLDNEFWIGVKAENLAGLLYANRLGADFAQYEVSHDSEGNAHWNDFRNQTQEGNLPIFALGTSQDTELLIAQEHGAQGIVLQHPKTH